MTRLILIRHGETDYSLNGRYCGFSNPPLNKKGISEAKKLSRFLKKVEVDKVYSSDMKRAFQTAKIIFSALSVELVKDFREMNFGSFEGLTHEEIVKRYPRLYNDWIKDPTQTKISGGESLETLVKRVKARLSAVLSKNKDKTVAVVTHGGPIRVILSDILGFSLEGVRQIRQATGALNIIDYPRGESPVIVKMNDISYLYD